MYAHTVCPTFNTARGKDQFRVTSLLMLVAFFLLAASKLSSSIPTDLGRPEHTGGPLETAELPGHFNVPSHFRGTQDILWSCLATIFACTWVAVHPNVSGPKESQCSRFRQRLKTMFYALIAPEMMTLWAMRQRYAAARIKREYNEKYRGNGEQCISHKRRQYSQTFQVMSRRNSPCTRYMETIKEWFHSPDEEEKLWSLGHGFFIQMGGLLFVQDGGPAFVITFDKLQKLIDNNTIDLPIITKEEIFDRSKGDFLTKLLVVIQTTWFIVQCTCRWAAKLQVTELEVVTLAFAILNIITYSLWWHKPQNVQVAVPIIKKDGAPSVIVQAGSPRTWLEDKIAEGGEGVEGWVPWLILVALLVPVKLLQGMFTPLGEMAVNNRVPEGSTQVPMFYADHDIVKESQIILPFLCISVIFGALHLIPWFSGSFPTPTERLIWQLGSIVITAEPLPVAIGLGLAQLTEGHRLGAVIRMMMDAFAMSLGSLAFTGLPLYVLARLALLTLAFSTLRSLPTEAFKDIAWSSLVPHV